MKRIAHLILLLSGLCSLSPCVSHYQYFLAKTQKTWYEAQSFCREKCLDLTTIDNLGEMETVLTAVKGKYNDSLWIGLWKGTTRTWHWSLADKDFYKEGERNYLVWGQETSNNCGYYRNGKLYSVSCTERAFSVCFDGTKLGREQYVLNTDTLTWTVAQNYCRTHHTDLASVRNAVESQIIQEVAGDSQVWVGLFRDPWTWSDQTYSSLRYWKASKEIYTNLSETTCVALLEKESGRWGERPCDEKHLFLCNCPTVKFFKVRISSQDSSLELNKVQDDISNQIKEKLRSVGVTRVTFRWKKYPGERVFNQGDSPRCLKKEESEADRL